MPSKNAIIIANCGGFWGDDPTAARRQVEGGPIDYLVMDYLAEVTMAILQKQKQRRPEAGYATDFLVQMREVLPQCVEKDAKEVSPEPRGNCRQIPAPPEAVLRNQVLEAVVVHR